MLPSKYELRPFFSFMVDDMIFFRDLNILNCMRTLEESQTSYAIHLKLSPNICYSHTNNKLITLPQFEPAETVKAQNQMEVVSSHNSQSRMMDDDNQIGAGLLGSGGGFDSGAAASMTRASHSSSLRGYDERET